MLKKTLAILCAMALLVSLLTVGITANATETTTDECYTTVVSEDFENGFAVSNDDVAVSGDTYAWQQRVNDNVWRLYSYGGAKVKFMEPTDTSAYGLINTNYNYLGTNCLRIYDSWQGASGAVVLYFFVPVTAGETYNVSFKIGATSGEGNVSLTMRNGVTFGEDVSAWPGWSSPNEFLVNGASVAYAEKKFTEYNYTVTPKYSYNMSVSLTLPTNVSLVFDDFKVEKIEHDVTAVAAVAPTATTDGVKAHYACSKCGALYTDAAGTTETTLADLMDRECNVVVNETFDNFNVTSADLVDSGKRFTKNSNGTYWHVYNASGIKLWESGGSYGFTAPSVGYTNAAGVVGTGFRMANVTGTTVFYPCFDVVEGRRYTLSFSLWNNTDAGQDGMLRLRKVTGYNETHGGPSLDTYYRFVGSSGNDVNFTTPIGDNVLSYEFIATESTTVCVNMQIYSAVGKYSVLDNFKVEESNHTYTQVPAREANCVYDGNVAHYTCTSCGKNWSDAAYTQYVDPTIPAVEHSHGFENYNLRLDGKIGLGFNATLCDGLTADKTATYAQFAIEGVEGVEKVSLNDAVKEVDGSYTFYCPLSSVQMGKKVTASLCYQSNVLDTATASANDYLADLDNVDISGEAKALAKATGSFTSFAETYFAGADIEDTTLDEISAVDANNHSVAGSADGVEFYGYDLVLNDGTDLRLYFKANTAPTFTVGGETAEAEAYVDGYYYVTISNIAAHELSKKFTVVANDGLTVEVCALSYANSVIKANYDKNLVKLCKALYNYSAAAAAYNAQ